MARFSISYDINEQPVGKNRPIRANFAGGSGSENSTAGAKTYTETLIALIPAEVASIYTFIIGFIPAVATEIEAKEFQVSLIIFVLFLVCAISHVFIDLREETDKSNRNKLIQIIFVVFAFAIWVYVVSGELYFGEKLPALGSVLMAIFALVVSVYRKINPR